MTSDEFLKIYWRQYRLLEKDFLDTDDYVSIDKDNYDTFSNQYLKLLLAICSEIDSIADKLCKMKEDKVPYGIKLKLDKIVELYPNLTKFRIDTKYPYYIKDIVPFEKFRDSISDWWYAYNDVKHRREEMNESGRYNYTKASLKNVLFALAALCILNQNVYKNLVTAGKPIEDVLQSRLFELQIKL